jgi:hypothetical protein
MQLILNRVAPSVRQKSVVKKAIALFPKKSVSLPNDKLSF